MQQYTILPSCLDYEHFVSQILGTPWHSLRIPTQANPPLDKVLILYKLVWALGFPHSYWLRIRLQCGRPGFDSWAGKIPWRRERLPTPVVWPGEFHGLYSPWGHKESDTTEQLLPLSTFIHTQVNFTEYKFKKWRMKVFFFKKTFSWTSLTAQLVKNLPAMQETPVRLLGREKG